MYRAFIMLHAVHFRRKLGARGAQIFTKCRAGILPDRDLCMVHSDAWRLHLVCRNCADSCMI